jgi:hypothetical protein
MSRIFFRGASVLIFYCFTRIARRRSQLRWWQVAPVALEAGRGQVIINKNRYVADIFSRRIGSYFYCLARIARRRGF